MTSRREFMKAGLAVSAMPLTARADFTSGVARGATVSLYKVLYDTRFPASVTFAQRAAAVGLTVHAIAGDMTRFWYDDLYDRWRQGAVAIAGLTAHGALFCLERLAWEQRMRVVYRGEHAAGDGLVTHRFAGPASLLPAAVGAAIDSGWARALADVVAGCPCGPLEQATAQAITATAGSTVPAETLFSWVIAPVARV